MIRSKEFKPQVSKVSDKYSWNLYRLFKNIEELQKVNPVFVVRFYWYKKSFINGNEVIFDPSKSLTPSQVLIILEYPKGQVRVGIKLGSVLALTPNQEINFSCMGIFSLTNLVDVTDWFLSTYKKDGRCIFDREHSGWWVGGEDRFLRINKKSRKCLWCGQFHKRKIKKQVVVERKEEWVV